MILGYLSILVTVAGVAILAILKLKVGFYYAGIFFIGLLLLLSTTLSSSQLIGSDVHLEYYYARLALLNGWDASLPSTINSCLPVVVLAPAISKLFHIDLINVFRIVYPVLYATVPVMLLYIYSRFMPIKHAYLAAMVFVILPTFFLEMVQVTRQMMAEIIVVAMLALLFSEIAYRWKMAALFIGSVLVVLSHYSTATFWMVMLPAIIAGFAYRDMKERTTTWIAPAATLAATVALFFFYSRWAGGGWQVVDMGNVARTLTDSTIATGVSVSGPVPVSVSGPVPGYSFIYHVTEVLKNNLNLIVRVVATIVPAYGLYRLLRHGASPSAFKLLTITAFLLLVAALIYPNIGNSINFTRYYQMLLIFLAPAIVFTFRKYTTQIMAGSIAIVFFVTSGLLFNLLKINNIENMNVPYSIALENKRLDAGNYLTADDDRVVRWAFESRIESVHGDAGGVVELQNYYDIFKTPPVVEGEPLEGFVFVRSWNTEHSSFAYWTGPGTRKQRPMSLPSGKILFQSGDSYILEVQ